MLTPAGVISAKMALNLCCTGPHSTSGSNEQEESLWLHSAVDQAIPTSKCQSCLANLPAHILEGSVIRETCRGIWSPNAC